MPKRNTCLHEETVNEELREIATVLLDAKTNMYLADKHNKKAKDALEHADNRLRKIYQSIE